MPYLQLMTPVIGVDLAANQAQRQDFFIVGVDGAPEAIKAIASKEGLYAATATQSPRKMTQKPSNPDILIPVQLVTRDNASTAQG